MTQLRGLFTFNDVLHAVRGNSLHRIDGSGTAEVLGEIGSFGGPVDFTANTTQLGITDGNALWVWNGSTLQQSPDYVPGSRICVVGQRLVFIQADSQKFGWSSLANMMVIDPLDFASAERVPDNVVSMVPLYGQVLLMGSESGEVWNNVGGDIVFQRDDSAYIEYGCVASHSLQLCGGSAMWLARRPYGQASVMQLQGYQAKAVSTRAIEERFKEKDLSGARAYVRGDGKQEFYCLNVPGVNTTLVYDLAFQQWHEEAELDLGQFKQFRARCHAFAYGRNYVGDNDGRLYKLDKDVHNFAGSPLCRERISPVISVPNAKEIGFPKFTLMCDKGTTGTVMMRYSDDNGANWSAWHYKSAGEVGEFFTRVRFKRLGRGYDRVYQVRMTDDAPFNPVSADAEVVK